MMSVRSQSECELSELLVAQVFPITPNPQLRTVLFRLFLCPTRNLIVRTCFSVLGLVRAEPSTLVWNYLVCLSKQKRCDIFLGAREDAR